MNHLSADMVTSVPVDRIEVGDRLRGATAEQVASLVESVREVGLLNPISVYRREVVRGGIAVPGWGLVAGLHRLEACLRLGLSEIPARVVELDDLHRQLAECDENLFGSKLSPAERARFTARRKSIYEAFHPETRQHVAGGKARQGTAGDKLSFAAETAQMAGVDRRTVERDVVRGERISEEVLGQVRGTELDKGSVLDALAATPRAEQAAKVEALKLGRAVHRSEPVAAGAVSKTQAGQRPFRDLLVAYYEAAGTDPDADVRRTSAEAADNDIGELHQALGTIRSYFEYSANAPDDVAHAPARAIIEALDYLVPDATERIAAREALWAEKDRKTREREARKAQREAKRTGNPPA